MKSKAHYWHLGWTKDIRWEEKSARLEITCSRANRDKLGTLWRRFNKTGHQCHKVLLKSSSSSITMTDFCICCSLVQIENGDCANLPQVILTINHKKEAHLHTLSWWLSAICQNSVVISGVSQTGAVLDAFACHNLFRRAGGKWACPARLVRTLQNWAAACC